MGQKLVLDTNTVIYHLDGRLAPLPEQGLIVSIITEIELLSFPKLTAAQEKEIRRMLVETIRTVGIPDSVKRHAIRLRRETKLKLPDAIIAATAISEDAELWTADSGFSAIAGLKCRIVQPNPG